MNKNNIEGLKRDIELCLEHCNYNITQAKEYVYNNFIDYSREELDTITKEVIINTIIDNIDYYHMMDCDTTESQAIEELQQISITELETIYNECLAE